MGRMLKNLATLSILLAVTMSFSAAEYLEKSFPSCENSSPGYQEHRKVDGIFIIIKNDTLTLKYCNTEEPKSRRIVLSWRGISKFSKDFATIPGLERMNLEVNCLVEIEAHVFKGLADLEELNLSANKISKVHPEAFDGLPKLRTLDLSYNRITEVSWSLSIDTLPALEELFLMHNELTTFERSETNYSPETNIIRMDLTGNKLSAFGYSNRRAENVQNSKSYYSLPNLRELYLSENQIGEFSSPDLILETLVLDNNNLEAFPRLNENARFVSLNKNQITCQSLSALRYLPGLAYLQLAFNNFDRFSCIDESDNPFRFLQNCTYLTLENNGLTTIQNVFSQHWPLLEYISVENNELRCMNATKITGFPYMDTIVYSGNPVADLTEDRFCKPFEDDRGRVLRVMTADEYWDSEYNWFKYPWNSTDTSINFLV